MTVTPLPTLRRLPIEGRNDIAAIEGAISSVAGVVAATGGFAALAGRDLFGTSAAGRAVLLTDMYEAGEVIFGWRDGRTGAVANVALSHVKATSGATRRRGWKVEIYVEDEAGHRLLGAFVEADLNRLARHLLAAASDGLAAVPSAAAALAAFVTDDG